MSVNVEITLGPPESQKVVVDGKDISAGVSRVVVDADVYGYPVVQLDIPILVIGSVLGKAKLGIIPATRDALIAMGWTPPVEKKGEVDDAAS